MTYNLLQNVFNNKQTDFFGLREYKAYYANYAIKLLNFQRLKWDNSYQNNKPVAPIISLILCLIEFALG